MVGRTRWDGLACCRVSRAQGCSGKVGRWSAEVPTVWMGDAGSRLILDAQKVWEVRLAGMDVRVGNKRPPGFCR